ncbi:MAG: DUF4440 domain-containing protein [Cytophagales bacterium]|nr:DUF4440 domain-containing protein [Cytophagales bacterium]
MNRLILLTIVILLGCQPTTDNPASDDEAQVKAALVAMWDAIEKGEVERYAGYVHPDFTQFGENDSLLLIGKRAEVDGIRKYTTVARNVHTEMINPLVTVKGDVAWITYNWKDGGAKDGVPFATQGKSTRIFVREKGRWLCIHGHYTSL